MSVPPLGRSNRENFLTLVAGRKHAGGKVDQFTSRLDCIRSYERAAILTGTEKKQ